METHRYPEALRGLQEPDLVALGVDARKTGDATHRETGLRERAAEKVQNLPRRSLPAAPDPGHERGRPVDHGGTRHVHGSVGHEQERRPRAPPPDKVSPEKPPRRT